VLVVGGAAVIWVEGAVWPLPPCSHLNNCPPLFRAFFVSLSPARGLWVSFGTYWVGQFDWATAILWPPGGCGGSGVVSCTGQAEGSVFFACGCGVVGSPCFATLLSLLVPFFRL